MKKNLGTDEIPEYNARKIIAFLNNAKNAQEIADAIEIPGERDVDVKVAKRILEYRNMLGGFKSLSELAEVPQVGPKRFNAIAVTIGMAHEGVEKHRIQFKQLIASNPNYFGNIPNKTIKSMFSPVMPMATNTRYEQIVCLGLYPEDSTLEAVIEVKLPGGYLGPLCSEGSKEYVAFYIDYNDGAGFVAAGPPAEVNVHDISWVNGGHLFYAVRTSFIPKNLKNCGTPQIVKVRAILSWQTIPTGPDYPPVWGNTVDCWVQIKPQFPFIIPIFPIGELPAEKLVLAGSKMELKAFLDESVAAEEAIKKEGKVDEKRFGLKTMLSKNPNYFGSITSSKDKAEIIKVVQGLPKQIVQEYLKKLAVNPDWLTPVAVIDPKVQYEELKCVGLYPEDDLLEAVIEMKLPYGFNGNLCTLGSQEYVAFYIDWGTGYQYVTTAKLNVHDIPDVATKHLFYAVKAKIPKGVVESMLKDCSEENIVKVKAILSWESDPTGLGPNYIPPWGNVLERQIQIRPNNGASVVCKIDLVSEVSADDIIQWGPDSGLAIKIDGSGNTVLNMYDRPFGGIVAIMANVNLPGAKYYRFQYSNDNGTTWKQVTDKRRARGLFGATIMRSPDPDGWFDVATYEQDVLNYSLETLVQWDTSGKDGKYLLQLELADDLKNVIQACSINLVLDNTWPSLFSFGGTPTPLPASGVVVKDTSGNYKKCDTFMGSNQIVVLGNFSDLFFRDYSLLVFGGNIASSGVTIGSGRYDNPTTSTDQFGTIGAVNGGMGQELLRFNLCTIPQTPAAVRCAYGIQLGVNTRTIVGYFSGYEFYKTNQYVAAFVTFDWDPTGC